MKRRLLRAWVGVPTLTLLVLGALIAESSDMPLLLPLGIVGLGSLTMASERWRGPASELDGAPLPSDAAGVPASADQVA